MTPDLGRGLGNARGNLTIGGQMRDCRRQVGRAGQVPGRCDAAAAAEFSLVTDEEFLIARSAAGDDLKIDLGVAR